MFYCCGGEGRRRGCCSQEVEKEEDAFVVGLNFGQPEKGEEGGRSSLFSRRRWRK